MSYDDPTTITHTKIINFVCPARYEKLHVLGLADTSDPARRGSTIHRANELYVAALASGGMPSDPDAARAALHQAIVDESTPAHLVADCEDLWSSWAERFELDIEAFLEAENRRSVTGFSFKPDMVFVRPEALEIVDLKTHYQGLGEKAAKADFQARMYSHLASQVWPGFSTYRFTFEFLRLRARVTVTYTPAELDVIGRQLAAHADAIVAAHKAKDWPAAPGDQCKWCTFACPAVDDAARTPVRLLSHEDAVSVARDVTVLSQALAVKRKALAGYCGVNGPVLLDTQEWGHHPSESVTFPAAGVIDLLRQHLCDVTKLTVNKTAVKAYLTAKKWAHVGPGIAALAVTKLGTRFGAKKVGGTGEDEEDEEL